MKRISFLTALICIGLFSFQNSSAQEKILAGEQWEQLTQQKFLADFFTGFFINMGVEVPETGEQITVLHKGEYFEIKEGINNDEVQFILPVTTKDVINLVEHAKDGKIDEEETYRILATMFTPLTAQSLQNPLMTENLPRFFNRIENNIHVSLFNPDRTKHVSHTLLYINNEWIVIPGLHGTPKRIFELNIEQALLYQQKVFEAMQVNTKKNWRAFKKWYLKWRKEVSV